MERIICEPCFVLSQIVSCNKWANRLELSDMDVEEELWKCHSVNEIKTRSNKVENLATSILDLSSWRRRVTGDNSTQSQHVCDVYLREGDTLQFPPFVLWFCVRTFANFFRLIHFTFLVRNKTQ